MITFWWETVQPQVQDIFEAEGDDCVLVEDAIAILINSVGANPAVNLQLADASAIETECPVSAAWDCSLPARRRARISIRVTRERREIARVIQGLAAPAFKYSMLLTRFSQHRISANHNRWDVVSPDGL
ncbi:hypothetical protein BMW22_10195 [Rhizobium leguminosarum]|uniref:Uncharacterized protein n=1 Tax=Rhizobium leguminosarum TaxID=384 RepID=A0A1L3Z8N6_RHILE|nr:hypothetical protein [Rhizobium leguminosarum]API51952.1 hypothetical protein BMW22_10195 [Rhizobium leguminosarum]